MRLGRLMSDEAYACMAFLASLQHSIMGLGLLHGRDFVFVLGLLGCSFEIPRSCFSSVVILLVITSSLFCISTHLEYYKDLFTELIIEESNVGLKVCCVGISTQQVFHVIATHNR
jgi:hypothetical protein